MLSKTQIDISPDSSFNIADTTPKKEPPPLYIESVGHYKAYSNFYNMREGLKSHVLISTLKGGGILDLKDRMYTLSPNSIVLIDCYPYHFYKPDKDLWEFEWFHFRGSSASYFYKLIGSEPINFDKPLKFFQEIKQNLSENTTSQMLQNYNLMSKIFTSIYFQQISNISHIKSPHEDDIQKAIRFINNNLENNITVDDIANEINVSKYYFIRLFKKQTDKTPYEYLLNRRLIYSKALLRETNYTVEYIATKCCFSSPSSFIRFFKSETGNTPNQYRINIFIL